MVKIPRFAFEKFPGADPELTTTMKSVGEAMSLGRNFTEALNKAMRSMETQRGGFWTGPDHDGAAAPGPDPAGYEVGDVLGEGGMGTVYKAEQRTPVKRTVAVKVVKAGMDTREVLARFESERSAVTAQLAAAVAPGLQPGGGEPSPDAELLARSLQALAEELARLLLADPERYPRERALRYAGWALRLFGAGG